MSEEKEKVRTLKISDEYESMTLFFTRAADKQKFYLSKIHVHRTDEEIPFEGILSIDNLGALYLVYLPKYMIDVTIVTGLVLPSVLPLDTAMMIVVTSVINLSSYSLAYFRVFDPFEELETCIRDFRNSKIDECKLEVKEFYRNLVRVEKWLQATQSGEAISVVHATVSLMSLFVYKWATADFLTSIGLRRR